MRAPSRPLIVALGWTLLTAPLSADVLELKDGTLLNGTYMGGSQTSMRFEVKGELQLIQIDRILALTITGRSESSAAPAAAPASAGSGAVPAGTMLVVRANEQVDTRNNKVGSRFTARLEGKLMAGNTEIAPAGARVYGRVVTAQRGGIGARKPLLELELTGIRIDGEIRSIKTNVLSGSGEGGGVGRKIVKGAAVGGLAGGSSGADRGARIGAGVAIMGGGNHIGIKSGTILEFTLTDPFGT